MEKLQANMMSEILGRPAENVKEALQTLVVKIGSEKGVKIVNKKIHEPIPAQDSKTLFTSFAEIEVEFDTLENYLATMFSYMPSNIEIIKPEKITLTNSQINELGNNLVQRLHNYDAITKKSIYERDFVLAEVKKSAPKVFEKLVSQNAPQPEKEKPKNKKSR